jgi:hypothetical protein
MINKVIAAIIYNWLLETVEPVHVKKKWASDLIDPALTILTPYGS